MDKRKDNLVRQFEGQCHHFNGVMNDTCKVGVNYQELAGIETGMALALPCMRSDAFDSRRRKELGISIVPCDRRDPVTREQAEAMADEAVESSARHMKAVAAAHADAKTKGLKKGNGGVSEMPCPIGCGGILKYSVSGYNGHMHAACSTPNCVRWME